LARGAAWGLASGFAFAVFTLINRRFAPRVPPVLLAAGENSIAAAALAPFLSAAALDLEVRDLAILAGLGLGCTALAHFLFMQGLARVRAHIAAVIATLEPVYGIACAALVLNEIPGPRALAGGALMIGAAAYASLERKR
jgi:drug/metabolite transporter (DMT)-like permease